MPQLADPQGTTCPAVTTWREPTRTPNPDHAQLGCLVSVQVKIRPTECQGYVLG
jgi:hypothetical protein